MLLKIDKAGDAAKVLRWAGDPGGAEGVVRGSRLNPRLRKKLAMVQSSDSNARQFKAIVTGNGAEEQMPASGASSNDSCPDRWSGEISGRER